MTDNRRFLKRAALGLLDAIGEQHPMGHQPSKANRYVLVSQDRVRVEIMFEKNDDSPPNLWCLKDAAGKVLIAKHNPRLSLAGDLWTRRGKDGPLYGRHSALEKMPQLGNADLVCFTPDSVEQIGQIVDRLRRVTESDIS